MACISITLMRYRSFPHTEKAGHFDETNLGAGYTCPCKIVILATWIDKGLSLEET